MIDPSSRKRIADIALKAHPESFQIDPDSGRIFVNLPDARAVAVVDDAAQKQTANWPMRQSGNFPMALDAAHHQIYVVFRGSSELAVFPMEADGKPVATAPTCGDADDLFVDAKAGASTSAVDPAGSTSLRPGKPTPVGLRAFQRSSGARTSLFVPELDRLLVAAQANSGEPSRRADGGSDVCLEGKADTTLVGDVSADFMSARPSLKCHHVAPSFAEARYKTPSYLCSYRVHAAWMVPPVRRIKREWVHKSDFIVTGCILCRH